ncbi:MAG: glycoside hydrolase family 99-like domain-containing protein [Armatimonadetes bacterium]|nr:glycoside hydrolase family 99-like domain-containing protein [Armatimonadota bacterium]
MMHLSAASWLGLFLAVPAGAEEPAGIRSFLPAQPLSRAQRPAPISAIVSNLTDEPLSVEAKLVTPPGVTLLRPSAGARVRLDGKEERRLQWTIQAVAAGEQELALELTAGGAVVTTAKLTLRLLPPLPIRRQPYLPEPQPVQTDVLVGAHNCPLWESDRPEMWATEMWANILKHPERTPALGFYGQESPEVADWETKWAVEHGVSFFIYCWYRNGQGGPVKMNFGSAIHDALFKSRFRRHMKYTIMWENQSRGHAGVSDERDLFTNLLPFWIENYFKDPGYLKMDGKPVLFIYRPEFLVQDLGGVDKVAAAFDKMRAACRDAGFEGLYLLGEYRGLDPNHLKLMKSLGLDYTFAYCWHVPNSPTPQQAIDAQMNDLRATQQLGILPQVATVSQAWSGWQDEGSIWKIPPTDFERLLRQAKDLIATFPAHELGRRLLLLDNWNEWGEGHYLAPYREYGFGYLDAVRRVFSTAPEAHEDLLPEDIGHGPYDTAYRTWTQRTEDLRKRMTRRVLKAGAPEEGLVGWWTFDENGDSPVVLDYSGNRHGGVLESAARAKGIDGGALVCQGGCAVVDNHPALSLTEALSIECWAKTDVGGQGNTWMVNRVFSGGINTGFRLGVLDGKPCFEVPQTDWSHHLSAREPLPQGRWVHLCGTFDGKLMRIYVDGEEQGEMERPGPIHANEFHLCLGNFELKHAAHFVGLLDEVKLYGRALSPAEVREHFQRLAGRARQ